MLTSTNRSKLVMPPVAPIGAAGIPEPLARWRRRLIVLFIALFALPLEPIFAGLTFTGLRLYVLLCFVPFLIAVFAGKAGRVTVTDVLMFGFGFWMVLTYVYHHGTERFPYAMITLMELVGGYLAGRLLVRNADDYRAFFQAFFVMLLVLLPFAAFEMATGRTLLSEILSQLGRVIPRSSELRNNYFRAGVSYPHPILWGLVASLLLAQAWFLWGDRTVGRWLRIGVAVACTVTAMSSAPILGLAIQTGLIIWGRLTGNRWWLLTILFTIIYLTLDLLSNRGPVIIMIETLTLNPTTAWWRVHIWNFGTQSVLAHPFLGIGLNDWARPEWLAPTVDNFWLVLAMRHGLPAVLMLGLGLVWHVWRILQVHDLSDTDAQVRTAYMIGFVALCFGLSTVHVWGAPSVFVMFYFGIGSFLYTGGTQPTSVVQTSLAPTDPRAPFPYTRFPQRASLAVCCRPLGHDGPRKQQDMTQT